MRNNRYWPETYLDEGEQKNPTTQQYTKASRSIEQVLLVDNSDSGLVSSMDIKKAFAKQFPNTKLIHAFRNSRGKIYLEFDYADTAANIMQNLIKSAMGTDTRVTNP